MKADRSLARRALLLQFTEPQRYPPIQHVAEELLAAGFQLKISVCELKDDAGWRFAAELEALCFRSGGPVGGWRGRLNYLRFLLSAFVKMVYWRPHLVYCSDLTATPLANLARLLGCVAVYHEHDLPAAGSGFVQRWLHRARRTALQRSDALVFPGANRAEAALRAAGVPRDERCNIVWNLPGMADFHLSESEQRRGPLRLYFHGSINDTRLPLRLLDAMAEVSTPLSLTVIGYETLGSVGYVRRFLDHAAQLGLGNAVEFHGAMSRESALLRCTEHDLGLCFYGGDDPNHLSMVGPSNKPFDYLACGLALLVPAEPEWIDTFVQPGYAYAVPADDPLGQALTEVLRQLCADPAAVRARGRAGSARVAHDWNYHRAFAPLLARLC